jgi:hypothetical protein
VTDSQTTGLGKPPVPHKADWLVALYIEMYSSRSLDPAAFGAFCLLTPMFSCGTPIRFILRRGSASFSRTILMYGPVVRLGQQSSDACNRNVKRRHPLIGLLMLLPVLAYSTYPIP